MEFKGTKVFPKFEGGDNYSIDMIFENESTISIDRRSRYTEQCNMSREEMEANALLISKAPEMLDMLNKVVLKLKGNGFPSLQNEIEQLIKEATEL